MIQKHQQLLAISLQAFGRDIATNDLWSYAMKIANFVSNSTSSNGQTPGRPLPFDAAKTKRFPRRRKNDLVEIRGIPVRIESYRSRLINRSKNRFAVVPNVAVHWGMPFGRAIHRRNSSGTSVCDMGKPQLAKSNRKPNCDNLETINRVTHPYDCAASLSSQQTITQAIQVRTRFGKVDLDKNRRNQVSQVLTI